MTGIYGRIKNPKIKCFAIIFAHTKEVIKSNFSYTYLNNEKIWKHNTDYLLIKMEKDLLHFR